MTQKNAKNNLKDTIGEITQAEQQKKKKLASNENSLKSSLRKH